MNDSTRKPHVDYVLRNNLVFYLLQAGFVREAEEAWSHLDPPNVMGRCSKLAIGGTIELESGRLSEAERNLLSSKERYMELGRDDCAAVVEIYRAESLLRLGRIDEAQRVACSAVSALDHHGVHQYRSAGICELAKISQEEAISRLRGIAKLAGGWLPSKEAIPRKS